MPSISRRPRLSLTSLSRTLTSSALSVGLAGVLLLVLGLPAPVAHAATRDVCKTACTYSKITDAITAAVAGDTITIGPGTYTDASGDAYSLLVVSKNLTFVGADRATTIIDGGGVKRVFEITSGATVSISNVTIQNGNAIDDGMGITNTNYRGGGVFNNGTLTLTNVLLTSNNAGNTTNTGGISGHGGAIYHNDTATGLTLISSTVSSNTAWSPDGSNSSGAGIYNEGNNLVVINSTFANNSASNPKLISRVYGQAEGGAIYNSNTATVINSTFYGNRTSGGGTDATWGGSGGGAISMRDAHIGDSLYLYNNTFTGNSADNYGNAINIYSFFGSLNLRMYNNIFSDGSGACYSVATSNDYGGNVDSDTSCIPNTSKGSKNSVATINLGALTGSPAYYPLGPDSGAISAGVGSICLAAQPNGAGGVDVRGLPRRAGPCDAGAWEAQPVTLTATGGSGQIALVNTAFTLPLSATVRDANNNVLGGVVVHFTVPGSGPSALLSMNPVTTTATGVATPTVTANSVHGAYLVTATVPFASAVQFSLRNYAILYAAPTPGGAADCSSWANVCDLAAALDSALPYDEIWLTSGVYTPGPLRTDTFQLTSGVSVYGGFAGTETLRTQRNPAANLTTLSGDIGTPGVGADNAYHVITAGSTVTGNVVLDGFTVSGGQADGGGSDDNGGGLYFNGASPSLQAITVTNNVATGYGGGAYLLNSSSAITSTLWTGNTAARGGALYNDGASPSVQKTAIYSNTATDRGGAVYNLNSSAFYTNVTFVNNAAALGGALYNEGGAPTLMHDTVYSNTASTSGGGLYNDNSNPLLRNTILWGNLPDQIVDAGASAPVVSYNVVEGGYAGGTNIVTADPRLTFFGSLATIALLPGSSAINTASATYCPSIDGRGISRPQSTACDIGAYEARGFTLTRASGNNQNTPASTPFSAPLVVTTTSATNEPVIGGAVVFTAPVSGASATPLVYTATIDTNGTASGTFTANAVPGAYTVTVSATGALATVSFRLINNGILYATPAGSGDCSSWGSACLLRTALAAANSGDEIWVAAGTYTPTTSLNRAGTFQLKTGVGIYGGFSGAETARAQRDWAANVVTLTGDLNNNGRDANDSYHVVTGGGTTSTAVLDGFTIAGGYANGANPLDRGAGVYIASGTPTLQNLTITGNYATSGGGLYLTASSATVLTSTVSNNTATTGGGGMYNAANSVTTLTNITFSGNQVTGGNGGGLYNDSSNPVLTSVVFTNNIASNYGGGLYNATSGNPVITATTIISNRSAGGGGLYNASGAPAITNSALISNLVSGAAAVSGGGLYNASGAVALTNVIFSGNNVTSTSGTQSGGGLYNAGASSPVLINVTFRQNTISGVNTYGGGMHTITNNPILTNVTFSGNQITGTSVSQGAGLYSGGGSLTATNVTLAGNQSNGTGQSGGGAYFAGGTAKMRNAILWGNVASTNSQLTVVGTSATISTTVVQGGASCTNCSLISTADPLLGTLGNYDSTLPTVPLLPGSSAINTANAAVCPSTDARGFSRVGACDLGAYEARNFSFGTSAGSGQDTLIYTAFASPLSATISGTGADPVDGGKVTFTGPGTGASLNPVSSTVTIASGLASVTVTANGTAGGPYNVTAAAIGASVPYTFTLTNDKAGTTITLAASPNPSVYAQSVTFTATVLTGATGSVTFYDNGVSLGTGALNGSGVATYTTAALTVGTHPITATYSGDANYTASATAGSLSQVVNQASSTIALTSIPNPSSIGQRITITATVSTGATGLVTFYDNGVELATGALSGSGVATYTTAALTLGTHPITATYAGDTNFNGAATGSTLSQVVNKNASTITLSSAPNPSTFGQGVTFTATVSTDATGQVIFYDNGAVLGASLLDGSAHAAFNTAALSVGTHPITATYEGDTNFHASETAGSLSQRVDRGTTTTAIAATPNPGFYGQMVYITATVGALTGTPTGNVSFYDNGSLLGSQAVDGGGAAIYSADTFALGTHPITATYEGDATYAVSTSDPLSEATMAATTTTLDVAPTPSFYGQSVSFTATVTSASGTPTGDLSFYAGGVMISQGTLDGSGVATYIANTLAAGTHPITATYSGATNYYASVSAPVDQVVNPAETTTDLAAAPNPAIYGELVMFTATVTVAAPGNGMPAGNVIFYDNGVPLGASALDGSGLAIYSTASLSVGNHPVTATYTGAANFSASVAPGGLFVVNRAGTTITLDSAPDSAWYGDTIEFTATVTVAPPGNGTPTGQVTFYDNGVELGSGVVDGSGLATYITNTLAVGTHPITATYHGDANSNASATLGSLSQNVGVAATTTALQAAPSPAVFGKAVVLTATVSSTSTVPAGAVEFYADGALLGSSALNSSGVATYTSTTLAVGTRHLTTHYLGNTSLGASQSPEVLLTVRQFIYLALILLP